mmetsp:Transcript_16453/g.31265  ORF Transcript_16453/g.31265 Transcript_16453/m.31265 type:complete len:81 (-) Transcript_16453:484-726(-)
MFPIELELNQCSKIERVTYIVARRLSPGKRKRRFLKKRSFGKREQRRVHTPHNQRQHVDDNDSSSNSSNYNNENNNNHGS